MKNKLYICEHQFVVSDKNICQKCCIEELKKTLENSVITTFDDTPIFNQQFLNQHSQMIDKTSIENLTNQNDELSLKNKKLTDENIELKRYIESQTGYFVSADRDLKNTIDSLQKINFTLNKDNSSLKSQLENQTEDFLSLEKSLKNEISKQARDYLTLEESYNKLDCSLYEAENRYKVLKENYNRLAKDECDNSRMLSMTLDDLVKTENKVKLLNITNFILIVCVIFFMITTIIRLFSA